MTEIVKLSPLEIKKEIQNFKREIDFLKNALVEEAELIRLKNVEQRVIKLDKIMQKHYDKNSN